MTILDSGVEKTACVTRRYEDHVWWNTHSNWTARTLYGIPLFFIDIELAPCGDAMMKQHKGELIEPFDLERQQSIELLEATEKEREMLRAGYYYLKESHT